MGIEFKGSRCEAAEFGKSGGCEFHGESLAVEGMVNQQIAMENGHRNSGFFHEKWWIFPWQNVSSPEGNGWFLGRQNDVCNVRCGRVLKASKRRGVSVAFGACDILPFGDNGGMVHWRVNM